MCAQGLMRICTRCHVLKLALIMYLYKHTEITQHEFTEWGIRVLFKGSVHLNDTPKNNFTKPDIYYSRSCGPPPPNTIRVSGIGFKALKSDICKKKKKIKKCIVSFQKQHPSYFGWEHFSFWRVVFLLLCQRPFTMKTVDAAGKRACARKRKETGRGAPRRVWWHRCRRTTQQLYLRAYTWYEWWLWKKNKKKNKLSVCVSVGVCVCTFNAQFYDRPNPAKYGASCRLNPAHSHINTQE